MMGWMKRNKITFEAPAKINLYLEVGALRPDGFHAVRTVMQAVDLCDLVEVELTAGGSGLKLEVEGEAPAGEENLCILAAETFNSVLREPVSARIRLVKRIPQAAGLGGGSSDAAAVLRALDLLLGGVLRREELLRMAASLGSDVPFFLLGGTVLAGGRGEKVSPLQQAPPLPVVLANPGLELPTAEVYRRFDREGGGEPPPQGLEALTEALPGGDVGEIAPHLFNSLQPAACSMMPEVEKLLAGAEKAGAGGRLVSGSGPTVFLLSGDEKEGAALEKAMTDIAPQVIRTRFRGAGVSPPST
jgi:4-diphosphocytidyl-2-C-methyl-D-erythritol kinase